MNMFKTNEQAAPDRLSTAEKNRSPEILDLSGLIRHDNLKDKYYDGEQLDALKDALDVEWIFQDKEGNEDEGRWCSVFEKDGKICLISGYFGNDPNAGSLENDDPSQWLQNSLRNVRAFSDAEALTDWAQRTSEFSSALTLEHNLIDSLQPVQ